MVHLFPAIGRELLPIVIDLQCGDGDEEAGYGGDAAGLQGEIEGGMTNAEY